MQYRRSVQRRMRLTELETSAHTESKRMTNHNTPQLSRMGLPVHCTTFPGLSRLNTRAVLCASLSVVILETWTGHLSLPIYLFIYYVLFNDSFNISHYMASNDRLTVNIDFDRIRKKSVARDLFAWRKWEKLRETAMSIIGILEEFELSTSLIQVRSITVWVSWAARPSNTKVKNIWNIKAQPSRMSCLGTGELYFVLGSYILVESVRRFS
jgi:hypothetical protein